MYAMFYGYNLERHQFLLASWIVSIILYKMGYLKMQGTRWDTLKCKDYLQHPLRLQHMVIMKMDPSHDHCYHPSRRVYVRFPFHQSLSLSSSRGAELFSALKVVQQSLQQQKKEKNLSSSLGLISAYIPRCNHLVVAQCFMSYFKLLN